MPEKNGMLRREDLPFVGTDDRGETSHWCVTPSGNPHEDRAMGFEYGRQAVAFMDQLEDGPQFLFAIVRAMFETRRLSHLEAGFFEAVGIATLELHNSLRLGLVRPGLFGKPIVYLGPSASR